VNVSEFNRGRWTQGERPRLRHSAPLTHRPAQGAYALVDPGLAVSALAREEAPEWICSVLRGLLKRGLDVVAAASVLLFALPLMIIVAVAIRIESAGPVFYGAERVSRGGRPMRMLKFRKMHRDASGPALTTCKDPRLTRVGAVLARTKLDELPQLINVLRGQMSLVGPRPEHPVFVAARRSDYEEILTVRPGITGLSQIAFAEESRILSQTDPIRDYVERIFPQKCALDRLYVRRSRLGNDLRILAWTAIAVLLRLPVAVNRATGSMRLRRRP
jgi:lipopolysaccharide/colanic/teichoic acid biosynthesis glycosyltransferase